MSSHPVPIPLLAVHSLPSLPFITRSHSGLFTPTVPIPVRSFYAHVQIPSFVIPPSPLSSQLIPSLLRRSHLSPTIGSTDFFNDIYNPAVYLPQQCLVSVSYLFSRGLVLTYFSLLRPIFHIRTTSHSDRLPTPPVSAPCLASQNAHHAHTRAHVRLFCSLPSHLDVLTHPR
jgi:hypothetical protein